MLNTEIKIGNRRIGPDDQPYVIAEAGSNFNQSLDTAFRLIDIAAEGGADCVKFQLFRADALYPPDTEMHRIFKSIELAPEWVPKLQSRASDRGLHFAASAFDRQSVDVLEAVGVPFHKIASSETTNLPFLAYIASKGKPMIISTGMCDTVDIQEAVNICLAQGNPRIALLQCVAMYPLPTELVNLRVMDALREQFRCPTGFSDHTLGINVSIAAVARGANIIEKHFTFDRSAEGPDHFYALEPEELKEMISSLRAVHAACGTAEKDLAPEERRLGRREGIYAARDIKAGAIISPDDLVIRRPALGIRERYLKSVVGTTACTDIESDSPINWEMIRF